MLFTIRLLLSVPTHAGRMTLYLSLACHVFFTARRYASAVFYSHGPVPVYVRHKSEFYRNGRTNRAGFWHGSFLPPILHCDLRKFGYLQKYGGVAQW